MSYRLFLTTDGGTRTHGLLIHSQTATDAKTIVSSENNANSEGDEIARSTHGSTCERGGGSGLPALIARVTENWLHLDDPARAEFERDVIDLCEEGSIK